LPTVTLPDWPALRERMLAPKPALVFTAYAIGRDPLKIHYDGDGMRFTNTIKGSGGTVTDPNEFLRRDSRSPWKLA